MGLLGWAAMGGGWWWCPVGGVPEDLWLTCRHLTHPLARHAPSRFSLVSDPSIYGQTSVIVTREREGRQLEGKDKGLE